MDIPPSPLLILDLDGTLVDSASDLVRALNAVLILEGAMPLSLSAIHPMLGLGGRNLITRGMAASHLPLSLDRLEILFERFLSFYRAHVAQSSRLYPGVLSALTHFAQAGWKMAICTNKTQEPAVELLQSLGCASFFSLICGQDTFQTPQGERLFKPNPDILLKIMEVVGASRTHSLMVGDSEPDILAARGAGIPVIAVDFGYSPAPVSTFGPDRIISHFDQLWTSACDLLSSSCCVIE